MKNWVCHIEGKDGLEYWYQVYNNDSYESKKHRNPVDQNFKHAEILRHTLDNAYDVQNVVLFNNLEPGSHIVSKHAFTFEKFKNYINPLPEVLNSDEINEIYDFLKYYEATPEELYHFRQRMAERYKDE